MYQNMEFNVFLDLVNSSSFRMSLGLSGLSDVKKI